MPTPAYARVRNRTQLKPSLQLRWTTFLLLVVVLPAWCESTTYTLYDNAVSFSVDPSWMIKRRGEQPKVAEGFSGLKEFFPGKGRGSRTISLNIAVFYTIHMKGTIAAARDADLENIALNRKLGNSITILESRALGEQAWYLLLGRPSPGLPLGEVPKSHNVEHKLHYVTPTRTMFIQLQVDCPVVQREVVTMIDMEVANFLSSFRADGQPMFPFGDKPPKIP